MCGRYTIIAKAEEIEKRFEVEVPEFYIPRYNAAPTQILPVITNMRRDGLSFFQWGLIPSWAKDPSIGSKMINARSETVHEKPAFKNAFKRQRCIVLADSFYEWKRNTENKASKSPYRIMMPGKEVFSIAGLWESFTDEDENSIYSFTIITTAANEQVSPLHNRMPVILNNETENIWLDNKTDTDNLRSLLTPLASEKLTMYPVSSMVNSARNDYPDLILPAKKDSNGGTLSIFN